MGFAGEPAGTPAGWITLDMENGTSVLRLVGEIDEMTITAFEDRGRWMAHEGGPVGVVDLTEVTFLSSAGVAFLVRLTREARDRGQVLDLRGLSNPARRVLHITGVTSLFRTAA